MEISNETKVKEIALSNPGARQILEDAGVDYCCGGSKSLHEACLHAEVAAEEILKRLRENKINTTPDEKAWISSPLGDLNRHIRERHHRYVRAAIPRLRALLAKVRGKHGERHREIGEIAKLFREVGREMRPLFTEKPLIRCSRATCHEHRAHKRVEEQQNPPVGSR